MCITQLLQRFVRKRGFPGVIELIAPIYQMSISTLNQINKNEYASFQLQAVCNSQLHFTYIHTGDGGSVTHTCTEAVT